jgi:Mn2+/Fe2+ NRAMP family transporter
MRAAVTYTSARILLFVAALALMYLIGARGLLLLALALVASGIISFVVLSRQRDAMSSSMSARFRRVRTRASEFGSRIDEGAKAEDED